LIPVNLGGVLKSLQQAITRQKIPFGRTPKIKGRTASAPLYIIAAYALLALWLVSAQGDFVDGHINQAAFALLNAAILFYAITIFIGFRASWDDITASLRKPIPAPASLPDDLVAEDGNVVVLQQKRPQRVQRDVSREEEGERYFEI
jgi:hypothetical protein